MTERVTSVSVAFANPFALPGVDGLQPAGLYDVESIDEQLDGLSFVAYRRLSTTIALHGAGAAMHSRQVTDIDPADLALALRRDAEVSYGVA